MTLKNKTGFYLKLLTPETMKLLQRSKNEITKDKSAENIPHLEITKVVLLRCNFVNNNYQHGWRVLNTFASNKLFGSWLEVSPTNSIFLKALNSEF